MKEDLTLVTMYYNLRKYEKRTQHYYLLLPSITYDMNINIVYFTESDFYDVIWKERQKRGLLDKTYIIVKEFSELKYYDSKDNLNKFFDNMPTYKRTSKDTINYMILVWNKIFFLEETINLNPFDTNYFGWIDFGLELRIKKFKPNPVENIFDKIKKKIRICETSNCGLSDLDKFNFCDIKAHRTAGGIFTGNSYYMSKLIKYFKELITEIINNKKLALEEPLIWFIMKSHPEIFDQYYGWYDTLLINYDYYKCGKGQIINVIYFYLLQKNYFKVVEICDEVIHSDLKYITPRNFFDLFEMYCISHYFINRNSSKMHYMNFLTTVSLNESMKSIFDSNADRIYNNILLFDDNTLLCNKFNKLYGKTPNVLGNTTVVFPIIEHISDLGYNDQYKI